MSHPTRSQLHGHLEVICGGMFSGKTEELLRRLKRAQIARQKVQVFKPALDIRYSRDHLQSHDANRIPSVAVEKPLDVLDHLEEGTRIVGLDEAQFFDASVVDLTQKLADRGIHVIVAGLDMDFLGNPFGPMPQLLAVAEIVTKLSAICVVCGEPATRTQKISGNFTTDTTESRTNPIALGAKDMYEARCRFCHEDSDSSQIETPGESA